ncbi:MAG: LytTR family transcriptional regulator DNA-binding domain-containing protein, partial [Bacteroidetes bacterium]|nr:LytTR family transcriptional regulator DNA-binding domain-containing protein [Bacteroidota bacterium]
RKRSRIALDEIILFYHASHIGYAYLINGEIWNTDYTLNTLEKKLPPDFGFRINRSLMVNWQSVRSYEALGNMQGRLTIKHPIEPRLNLMISRNRFKNFKKNYEQYKGRKRYLNKF